MEYRRTFYRAPHKAGQKAARQASNVPIKDGFIRSEMVHHQPSEMPSEPKGGDMFAPYDPDTWDMRSQNTDIEESDR